MNSLKKTVPFFFMAFLILGYIKSASHIYQYRENLPAENKRSEALLVSPELLSIASGEFESLLSDFLLLKAAVFIGGAYETKYEDWLAVWHLFNQSHYLDPVFFQTCYYTQSLLAWRKGLHEKSINLIKSNGEHRTWDWEPQFYAGFDYYYHLRDYKQSAKYLKEAARFPKAPPLVATLGARIARKGGQTQDAINLLYVMYHQAKEEDHRQIVLKRIHAYQGISILEKAIADFSMQFGLKPASLQDLVDKQTIPELPKNPFGDKYYYDRSTGHIYFDDRRL
jgi:tetratricopeptide (TPR) repeat protein